MAGRKSIVLLWASFGFAALHHEADASDGLVDILISNPALPELDYRQHRQSRDRCRAKHVSVSLPVVLAKMLRPLTSAQRESCRNHGKQNCDEDNGTRQNSSEHETRLTHGLS